MINRRILTSGLLASLATGLGSCGGGLNLGDAPTSKDDSWKKSLGDNQTSDDLNIRKRRTTPARSEARRVGKEC